MKRVYASLCAALLGVGSMQAERGPLILNSLAEYHVSNLSPNGEWACGWFENYSLQAYAFRWNLKTNNVEILSNDDVESCAFDVSNNGVVCGWFYDANATANGAKAQSAGYWDGTWHSLPNVNNEAASSVDGVTRARSISPDGHYVGGLAQNWGAAVVWKDGQIFQSQSVTNAIVGSSNDVYAVSSDGTMMAGWATPSNSTYDGERVPILWRQGKDPIWLADADVSSPYTYARAFSSNDRWLLYWGGYVDDATMPYGVGLYAIYDTQNDKKIAVPCMADDGADLELSDINANGTAVGRGTFTYKFDGEEADSVVNTLVMYKDGKTIDLVAYLKEHGVDITTLPGYVEATSVSGISDDEKTFAIYYTDENYGTRSSIIKLDQQLSTLPPVQLAARTLSGTQSVRLTWEEPLSGASAVQSYEVYRGTEKVGTCQPSDRFFFDGPLANGTYDYTVKAVYAEGTSESSEKVTAEVSPKAIQAPTRLTARQARLSGARLQWEQPQSNLTVKNFYTSDDAITGFGATTDFECALRFPASEMALYSSQRLTAVSFYPMSEQKAWTINVYTKTPNGNDLTLLSSQAVSQKLAYGKKNTVTLVNPLSLPAGKDIYVAVKVNVDETSTSASSNAIGQVYGLCEIGFSDMVRQAAEADFYSVYESAQQSGSLFAVTWAMDAIFSPEGTADNVDLIDHYAVSVDGTPAGTTSDLSYEVGAMTEGTHALGVAAVYASGETSAPTTVSLDVKPNEDFYKAISDVNVTKVGDKSVRANWDVPTDADNTVISYAKGNMKQGVTGNSDVNYSYMAAADYTPSYLHSYEGYKVTALRYMPLCDAVYTLTLQCDGVDVAVAEPEDYTLNSWNSVKLSSPVTIEAGKTYRLIVDCYDVESEKSPLAIDDMPEFSGVSNLLSTDNGKNFSALYDNASLHGNWLIGFEVESADERALPVTGYDIYVDRKKVNTETVTTNSYVHELDDADETRSHTLRVDAIYDVKGSVRGTAVFFTLSTTGINDAMVASIAVDRKGSVLSVSGAEVKALTLVSAAGQTVKKAQGSEIDVTTLPAGAYVLSVQLASGKVLTQKLLVK